jgi:hypothetical protein
LSRERYEGILYSAYFVKLKLGSKEKDAIPLDQEVQVCG